MQPVQRVFDLLVHAVNRSGHWVDGPVGFDSIAAQPTEIVVNRLILGLSFNIPECNINSSHGVDHQATTADVVCGFVHQLPELVGLGWIASEEKLA